MRQGAAFACRSPQRLSRCRWILSLLACMGLTPQSEANERSLTSRWGVVASGQEQRRGDVRAEAPEGGQGRGDLLSDAKWARAVVVRGRPAPRRR